jgi:hypothetical protein
VSAPRTTESPRHRPPADWRRRTRAGLACALAFAWLACAQAALAQATAEAIAAVEAARAEAQRDFATAEAAASAYQRLVRLREPLLALGDARAPIWMTDAAEDAILLGMAVDDAGITALTGLRNAASRERAGALLRETIAALQRAEESARLESTEGAPSPGLAERLEAVERAQRIPLLRSVAAVMAARVGAIPADDTKPVLEAAVARLRALRPSLRGAAEGLAALGIGLGCAQLGRAAEAQQALAPIAADARADRGTRLVAIALLAETASDAASERRRALALLCRRYAAELDDRSRLLLGDTDFRFAREGDVQGAASAPPWQGWMDALAATPAARQAALRSLVLDRIAANVPDEAGAVPAVARALRAVRAAETRGAAAAALAQALAAPALPPEIRVMAEFELGRAELHLGRARDGAARMLRFAQEHPADPASRTAIEAAVLAARGLGDAPFLATVLATAVQRFPDHPDHAAWRVEAEALDLSPDAGATAEREPPIRRLARALEALDRAERARRVDPALLGDLAAAAAQAANETGQHTEALAALDRLAALAGDGAAGAPPIALLPADLRARILEERVAALAGLARSIEADPWVRAEQAANADAAANACARVLRRSAPLGLAPGLLDPPSAEARARMSRLADATLVLAPATPDRDDVVSCALLLAGRPDAALPVARRALAARGEREDTLLALAECLQAVGGDQASLAEAMRHFTRLSQACAEGSAAWWIAELRRLQILERVRRNVEVIGPRIARLEAAHPDLGSPALRAEFLALAARNR